MRKDINNYLHLYLGCDCMWAIIVPGQEPTFERCQLKIRELHGVLNNLALCKPILRHLSSMTEEEQNEVWHMEEPIGILEMEASSKVRKVVICPERMKYLLSKGFDLFGLIDEGLAIDAVTIKTND